LPDQRIRLPRTTRPSTLRRAWVLAKAAGRTLLKPSPHHEPPLLSEIAPEFAAELANLLDAHGEPMLARSVTTLSVVELCNCNDPRCASFYTIPSFTARWRWPQEGSTIDLNPIAGTIRVDTAGGQTISVEILDRPQLATTLQNRLGMAAGLIGDDRLHRKH
jgi:hypothetical protein